MTAIGTLRSALGRLTTPKDADGQEVRCFIQGQRVAGIPTRLQLASPTCQPGSTTAHQQYRPPGEQPQ
jgi:hypothetical protein